MNLLIVDDEIQIIEGLMTGILWEQLDFKKVRTARSYESAIKIMKDEDIDLLLADIEMSDHSGLDLIRWVNVHCPKTECLILSCHDEFDFARQAVQLRCLDYILKPIPYETLTQILVQAQETVRNRHSQGLLENYGKVYIKQMSICEGDNAFSDAVDDAVAYIKTHISENISVEGVAKIVHVSPRHLTRLFNQEFGQSVNEYILDQRMMLAGRLLENTNLTVTMVSDRVGYSNYSYFIKLFKKFYGITPSKYQLNKKRKF